MEPERVEKVSWVLPPEVFDEFYDRLVESEELGPGDRLTKLFRRPSPFTRECD